MPVPKEKKGTLNKNKKSTETAVLKEETVPKEIRIRGPPKLIKSSPNSLSPNRRSESTVRNEEGNLKVAGRNNMTRTLEFRLPKRIGNIL
ncbi:hypothetical protein RIR_jg9731.t1 [Rhizophagus irregularis DAOM 181602=DAOM 197198]|nr:hypothetical protein RIR_jg9731.t1 [Rhizophagus irregularis DAOM 181602=DAOM 197198]